MLNIKENISLALHTTFKIGGPANFFCEINNKEELKEALEWVRKKNLPYFVLGGGSNLLVSDKGFAGLVIKMQNYDFAIEPAPEGKIIRAGAGVPLAKIVSESAKSDMEGIEWAIGIPGTIGGGVCGNCGAYGHSVSEVVVGGKLMDEKGEIVNFNNKDFNFRYRGSILKEDGNKLVLCEVILKLESGKRGEAALKMKEIIAERAKKIPCFPSVGSFLKNYKLKGRSEEDVLVKKFPDLTGRIRSGKLPIGYLLEQCGLKGTKIGGATIADEHANFIVNTGGATAKDVMSLAKLCIQKVKEKYGIDLEIEKKLLGF